MTLVTLQDLHSLLWSERQAAKLATSKLQEHLDLVIRQAQVGLNPMALVASNPQLGWIVEQLQATMPIALQPTPHLQLGVELAAPLTLRNETTLHVQISVNLGYRRGVPKLLDWSLRRPHFNWIDATRLWVATEFYRPQGIVAHQLRLVVVALHPTRRAQSVVFGWNDHRHQQMTQWILQRIQGQAEPELPIRAIAPADNALDLNALLRT